MDTSSCISKEPFIKLGSGQAPTLDYSLPQETCFSVYGRMRAPIDEDYFLPTVSEEPETHFWKNLKVIDFKTLPTDITQKLEAGIDLSGLVRNSTLIKAVPVTVGGTATVTTTGTASTRSRVAAVAATAGVATAATAATAVASAKTVVNQGSGVNVDLLVTAIKDGYLPSIRQTFWGTPRVTLLKQPPKPAPGIYVVEEYKVCSYLGDYGAGKTVKTFSLLPGEKTTISVTSYVDRTESSSYAENILDSMSQSAADSFESTLQEESGESNSETETTSESNTTSGGGGLSLSIPIEAVEVGVSAEASASHTTTDAATETRESYTKNISSAIEKHSTTSNSSREVSVNTTTSETTSSGESTSTTRELANINHSRVLNFVFRQLLQEYITITHLKDVRFIFTNGYPSSTKIVDITGLKPFLKTVLEADKVEKVFSALLKPYCKVYNYLGTRMSFIERVVEDYGDCPFAEPGEKIVFWRKRQGVTDNYEGFNVDGVILKVQKTILRTDSLVVDALLGQGEALDCYNQNLQAAAVTKAELENTKIVQAMAIVDGAEDAALKAEAYAKVFGTCCDDDSEEDEDSST